MISAQAKVTRQKSLVRSNGEKALSREQAGPGVQQVHQENVKKEELELRMVGMESSSSVPSVCTTPSLKLPFLTVHSPSTNGDLPLEARFEGR